MSDDTSPNWEPDDTSTWPGSPAQAPPRPPAPPVSDWPWPTAGGDEIPVTQPIPTAVPPTEQGGPPPWTTWGPPAGGPAPADWGGPITTVSGSPPPPPPPPPAYGTPPWSPYGPYPARSAPPRRWGWAVVVAIAVLLSFTVGAAAGLARHNNSALRPSVDPSTPATAPIVPGANGNGSTANSPSGGSGQGSTGSSSTTLDSAGIAAAAAPGIVNINTRIGDTGQAAGTGMIITSSGEVLTNNHVIENATSISVQIGGTGPSHPATVLGYDVTEDVALLQIKGVSNLQTVKLGDSSTVNIGDRVVAMGNALGRGGAPAVVEGVVTALNQTVTADDGFGSSETLTGTIQMNAPIQPGDSGGPLLNSSAEVIGMNTAGSARSRRRSSGGATQAFAITINKARSIVQQVESGRTTDKVHIGPRPLLGVQISDVGAQGFGGENAPVNSGALIAGTTRGGPAAGAGMKGGDVIVAIDGETVASATDVGEVLSPHRPGDSVSVGWVDQSGKRHNARVKLASGVSG